MKKKIMLPIVIVCMLFLSQMCVYAAQTWSNSGAYEISEDDGWHNHTTEGIMLGNYKTTESSDIEVYTVSKTMSSRPVFRLINSEEKSRSKSFSTAETFRSVKNSSNTGIPGYVYYASIKPAWNQSTDDQTIRIQFKSY